MVDLVELLALLKAERALVEEAIAVLRKLALKRGGRPRGRPPAWMKEVQTRRGRPKGSKNKPKQPPGPAAED